jgi:Cu+-exporting ATPase
MSDVHQRQYVTVTGDAPAPRADREPARGRRRRHPRRARRRRGRRRASDLHFAFTDARTGEPVDDLQPFLAAAGHVVVMRADATTFATSTPRSRTARAGPHVACPAPPSVLSSTCHAQFDEPPAPTSCGGSSGTADGDVLTVPFTVDAG